eukprot:jgi/Chlat1/3278/Chrsp22S03526
MAAAAAGFKRLVPLLDRVLIEKVLPQAKSAGGVLLPETAASKLNHGQVVAVGTGARTRDGNTVPVAVKVGDTVLLPEFGGTNVKLGEKDYVIFRDDDILGVLQKE